MRPQPLKLVIERYRRLRDEAVAVQARAQIELDGALRMLQTLTEYRAEQLQRARDAQQNPLSAGHLLLQTRFSGKLDEAIALQAQRVEELRQRIGRCRLEVLRHQQRLKAIETIQARRQARAADKAQKADQVAIDERAANSHAHRARLAASRDADVPGGRASNFH